MEELYCAIPHILESRDWTIVEKLAFDCYNFRETIVSKINDTTTHKLECMEKRTSNANRILELQQEIEASKTGIDKVKLEQKMVDRKIFNLISEEEKLKDEVDNAKSKRDSLSLEIVDLQQELEKRKEKKLATWHAIKRACHVYKEYLDFHIYLENQSERNRIKVSFFINDPATKNKYYVYLNNGSNRWEVEDIQPELKKEYLTDFKGTTDFPKRTEITDITAFLCHLRHIFLKYYINTK